MTDWHPIATAPKDTIILLGTESDPFVDKHMFFIDMGWSHNDGFWSMVHEGTIYPSHWAPITSPINTAPITHYKNCEYRFNEEFDERRVLKLLIEELEKMNIEQSKALRTKNPRVKNAMSAYADYLDEVPMEKRLAHLLREARQYVADAGNDEDSETVRHSASLLEAIDSALDVQN